jgi:hypothetical protein
MNIEDNTDGVMYNLHCVLQWLKAPQSRGAMPSEANRRIATKVILHLAGVPSSASQNQLHKHHKGMNQEERQHHKVTSGHICPRPRCDREQPQVRRFRYGRRIHRHDEALCVLSKLWSRGSG